MEKIKKIFLDQVSFFFSLPALVWQTIFLGLPMLVIFYLSITDGNFFGLTLEHFRSVVDYTHFKVIFRSLITAFISSMLCLIIGYPVAYFLAFKVKKGRNFLLFLFTIPLWVNFLVQVYAWFFILEQGGLLNRALLSLRITSHPFHMINNTFAVILVMVHVYLPFMIMPLYNTLEKFDKQLIEASLDLGAGRWTTFRRVTFPLSLSGINLGFFLVFVMSFGEVIIPLLLGGNKNLFVGTLISDYFIWSRNVPQGAAFTILSILVLSATMFCLYLFTGRKLKGVK